VDRHHSTFSHWILHCHFRIETCRHSGSRSLKSRSIENVCSSLEKCLSSSRFDCPGQSRSNTPLTILQQVL
jgi:hypothetical protein